MAVLLLAKKKAVDLLDEALQSCLGVRLVLDCGVGARLILCKRTNGFGDIANVLSKIAHIMSELCKIAFDAAL